MWCLKTVSVEFGANSLGRNLPPAPGTTRMSARQFLIRSGPKPRRFAVGRAALLLLLSAAFAGVVGCSTYDTLKTTVGNSTDEIDSITAEAENPIPEIYAAAHASAPITTKSLRENSDMRWVMGL